MTDRNIPTEFVRLLRFQILDARNGAISGEPDAIRLCGYAADEIERLQLLAADYGGQLTAANAEIARLRAQVATEYCRGRDHEARARADASKPIEPFCSRMSVIARFIRNQVSLADRPPPGCIQLNNDEAILCAEALERVTGSAPDVSGSNSTTEKP